MRSEMRVKVPQPDRRRPHDDFAFFDGDFLPAVVAAALDFFAFLAFGASASAGLAAASTVSLFDCVSPSASKAVAFSSSSSVRSRFFSARPFPSFVALRSALRFSFSSARF
jgi:hypothetical protein